MASGRPSRVWWLGVVLMLGLMWLGQDARAARAYFDSTFASVSTICPVTNNVVIATQNTVGYFTDPNEPYPKTGDIAYVRANSTNVSPCTNDTVGFDFFLPEGANFVISAQNPVYCYMIRLSDNAVIDFSGNPSGFQGACAQSPQVGNAGGVSFGWAVIPSGWQMQIRVPVQFNKQLLGLGGPNTHRLAATAVTAYGNATPVQPVTVFYEADYLSTQVAGVTSSGATLSTNLFSYFKDGLLYVDYGTSNAFGSSTPGSNVPNTALNFPNVSASLTGLSPNTTYYARFRFVTTSGTFHSPTQTFTTSAAPPVSLTVSKTGAGSGTVTSNPSGINCGATCLASFAQGTSVTLTATPAPGSVFAGWSGGSCSGTGTCTLPLTAAQTVTAAFAAPQSLGSLSLEVSGLPSGNSATLTITGPNGFSQNRTLLTGTGQTLSDVPTGTYTVTAPSVVVSTVTYNPSPASQNVTVTPGSVTAGVTYTQAPATSFTLGVSKTGTGQGTLSSNPSGIDCGTTCSARFSAGASVTLTATPAPGSSFVGWSGACTGSGTCALTMDAAKSVTATFNQVPAGSFALTLTKAGAGQGTVTSSPAGVDCGSTCAANFSSGTSVTLSATAASGSSFAGWSGACNGSGTCTLTMDAAKAVTATFNSTSTGGLAITAAKPANAPQNAARNKGEVNVPLLAFTLAATQAASLQSVGLQAGGSGSDHLDLTAVKLIRDANANGQIDTGETPAASGTFSADNGTLTLTLSSPVALGTTPTPFIVAVDIAGALAARPSIVKAQSLPNLPAPLLLALLPMLLWGAWRMRSGRGILLALALALTLVACGGGQTPTLVNKTYQINLTTVGVQGSPTVNGLPVPGATITVQK
ncbi:MAG TPA: hypothetical protein VFS50_16395 [Meiothermus sp.]|nr:hypothetical protein [Meiothermus sp.]